MPFVWSIGTIIGPAIGGILADPHESWPNAFPKGTLFANFPYLLPNLCCAALLLISICLGYFLLQETHPDMVPRVMLPDDTYVSDETPLMETSDAIKQPAVDLRAETYGTFRSRNSVEFSHDAVCLKEAEKKNSCNIFTKRIMALVVALSIFTYHSMTYDHLLPIFFEDDKVPMDYPADGSFFSRLNPLYSPGGLGLSMQSVGFVMAVNGVIALFFQVVVFPLAAEKFGVFRLFILVTILHPIAYVIVPTLVHLPESLLYPGIYFCLTIRNFFSIILYPLLLILIKDATPSSSVLGKVNGLAASAGAACRMVAPPVAGYLYSIGSQIDCTGLAWYGSAIVAVIGAFQCFAVKRDRNEDISEESGMKTEDSHMAPIQENDQDEA